MKKFIYILSVIVTLNSCADYLDIVPDQTPTIEDAFVDRVHAERFLATLYSYMPAIGHLSNDPGILASDEWVVVEDAYFESSIGYLGNRIKQGLQNVSSPMLNYWDGSNYGRGTFVALRECNIFLENINLVGPDLPDLERASWIAEVKFLKAFYHFYLMRLYGPIPLIKDNLPISAADVKVYREPVDDCIEFICDLCDEAMKALPLSITNIANENGRIVRPMAAMLKAQARIWGASPLFNGNSDVNTLVDNRGVHLFSQTEDRSKWTLAAEACRQAIDVCHEAGIRLFHYTDTRFQMSDTTKLGMDIRCAVTQKWNEELIWGNPVNTVSGTQSRSLPFFKTEDRLGSGPQGGEMSASLDLAETFYSNNGVPIDEDRYYPYEDRYKTVTVGGDHYYYIKEGTLTANLNTYREPRFYASLGFDGGYWYGNGRTKDVGMGTDTETSWIVRAKMSETSGKQGDIRYSRTGYFAKKPVNFETATSTTGALTSVRYTHPIMRLADLYLLYAEALNETLETPSAEVYQYIDAVRERAGLKGVVESWNLYSKVPDKPLNKTGLREIIQRERMIELCLEGQRFYDLRRWKLAQTYFNKPEKGWNVDQNTADGYYEIITFGQLTYPTRYYFWPIAESELRRNINLVQSPYW